MGLSDRQIGADILDSCRQGDRDAFRVLYETYKDKVYSISLYFFHGDSSAASDATQQVFLKLITNIGQFRGDSGFSTWLYRLVVNTCLDGARRAKSQALEVPEASAPAASLEDALAREQLSASVREAVSGLPAKFRLAILLRYFEELSYEEMATILNCSAGTVASRLSRGHRLLAKRLAPLKQWFATREE